MSATSKGNNNIKGRDGYSFLSHLAHRWADVIEMIYAAEPWALKSLDLSGLAEIAWAEQLGDEFALENALINFANYLKNHLVLNYCRQTVNKLINETLQCDRNLLCVRSLAVSGFFFNQRQRGADSSEGPPSFCAILARS